MSAAPFAASPEVLRHSWAQLGISILAGLREIWAHKFRSLLTMLGIILGVSSLVAMSALVSGMEKGAKEALVAIGGLEKVRIEPQGIPVEQRHLSDQATGITINDVEALEQSAPLVTAVVAGNARPGDADGQREDVPPLELRGRVAGGAGDERTRRRAWPHVQRTGRRNGPQRLRHRHRHAR